MNRNWKRTLFIALIVFIAGAFTVVNAEQPTQTEPLIAETEHKRPAMDGKEHKHDHKEKKHVKKHKHGKKKHAKKKHAKKKHAKGLHTCPMKSHWHVLSSKAGKCWLCEMKLVPIAKVKRPKPKKLFRCPMKGHHHVMSDKAGKCFICKMKMVKFK